MATPRSGVRVTVAIPAETLRAAKAGDARALKTTWRRCIRALAATAPEAARSDAIGAAVAKALVKGLKNVHI